MPVLATSTLDALLTMQLNLAWAGEHDCDPPRRGWWRANLSEPANGGYFTRSLAPRTWAWSSLMALREAGRRADARASGEERRADRFAGIFRIAPKVDQRLDERLDELRSTGRAPHEALPDLLFRLTTDDADSAFDPQGFDDWLRAQPAASATQTPTGLRLVGDVPADPLLRVRKLTRLLAGHEAPGWPYPHAEVRG